MGARQAPLIHGPDHVSYAQDRQGQGDEKGDGAQSQAGGNGHGSQKDLDHPKPSESALQDSKMLLLGFRV